MFLRNGKDTTGRVMYHTFCSYSHGSNETFEDGVCFKTIPEAVDYMIECFKNRDYEAVYVEASVEVYDDEVDDLIDKYFKLY